MSLTKESMDDLAKKFTESGDHDTITASSVTHFKRVGECVLCYTNQANGVIFECGHGNLCYPCGVTLLSNNQPCHMC